MEVVQDPAPPEDGGFPKGARFTEQEYRKMVKDGVFTPGTMLVVKEKPVKIEKIGGMMVAVGG